MLRSQGRQSAPALVPFLIFAYFFHASCSPPLTPEAPKTPRQVSAFLGDSFSSGFLLDDTIQFDASILRNLLQKPIQWRPSEEFKKIGPTPLEAFDGIVGLAKFFEEFFTNTVIESRDGLWPEQLALDEGKLILARSGSTGSDLLLQTERLLYHLRKQGLILKSVFFFTGQDALCSLSPQVSPATLISAISTNIKESIAKLQYQSKLQAKKGHPPIRVFVLGPLPLLQILSKPFRDKRVSAHGTQMSCEQLVRTKAIVAEDQPPKSPPDQQVDYLLGMLPLSPVPFCPGLLNAILDSSQNSQQSAALFISGIRKGLRDIAERETKGGFQVKYLESTEKFLLSPDIIGQDCYHLSRKGQEKLGQAVAKDLL